MPIIEIDYPGSVMETLALPPNAVVTGARPCNGCPWYHRVHDTTGVTNPMEAIECKQCRLVRRNAARLVALHPRHPGRPQAYHLLKAMEAFLDNLDMIRVEEPEPAALGAAN